MRRFGCALLLGLTPAAAARAATATDTFQVTANVLESCVVTAADLAFGDYDPVSATPLDAATTISVRCTNSTPYHVALDSGQGAGATIAARRMEAGADQLAYTLYRDAARTQIWGQTQGVDTVSGTGTGAAQSLNLYGRIPIQQAAPAGLYTDSVIVTVSY